MFDFYLQHEYWFAATQLILAMLGMGATLRPADFVRVFSTPRSFGIGIVMQILLVPLLAWLFVRQLGGGPGLAIGLAVCAAVPGGTVSNIFTYLSRGHIALSIALTAVATLACLVTTPLILQALIAEHLPADFRMPAGRIALEIALTLLLPLLLGMAGLRLFPRQAPLLSRLCIRGSLLCIALIVIGALGAGRLDLESFGTANVGRVAAFIGCLALLSLWLPRWLGSPAQDVSAINIEITVRNTNLGVLLKASLFPAAVGVADPLGDQVLFTVLLYGGLMLLLSALLIPWHRRRTPRGGLPT